MKKVIIVLVLGLTMVFFGALYASADMSHDMGAMKGEDMQDEDMPDMPMMGGGMMNCGMMTGGMGGGAMTGGMPCGMMGGCGMMRQMGPGMMQRGMMDGMGCGMMRGGMMGQYGMMRMLADLNLDEKQKETIGEIRARVMKETIRKRAERQIAMVELRQILAKEPVDMKAAEAKMKQAEALRVEIFMNFIKAREEMKSKLTPDQMMKMKGMMEQDCGMMGRMPGGMMPEMKGHEDMMEHHHDGK